MLITMSNNANNPCQIILITDICAINCMSHLLTNLIAKLLYSHSLNFWVKTCFILEDVFSSVLIEVSS